MNFKYLFISILFPVVAHGADLHVGSGQTYSTIASAITASSSGDTIYIHEGTYLENNLQPKENTTISGVDGEALPVIDANQSTFNHDWDNNPFSIEYDDITLYRLDIRDGATASVVLETLDNFEMSYCRLIRSSEMGTETSDNAALLYVKPFTTNVSIHHNYFETYTDGFGATIFFEPDGATTTFYNNECRINASGSCFFVKHAGDATGRLQVYNNFAVMDVGAGNYYASAFYVSHDNVDIKNNLTIGPNTGSGVHIAMDAGGCGGSGMVIENNTFYNPIAQRGQLYVDDDCSETNITFKNNIFYRENDYASYRVVNGWIYGSTQTWKGSYNLIQDTNTSSIINTPSGTYTMTTWKATGQGTGSYDETPVFVNGSGNLNLIADFEILSGNALNGGDDGNDMGANITFVGTGVSSSNVTGYGQTGNTTHNQTGTLQFTQ